MYKVIYTPRAEDEVEQAVDWYNEQQDGLAERFLFELRKKLAVILKQPDRYAIKSKKFRVAAIDVFPYQIIYSIEEEEQIINIQSIFHIKRNPQNKY